MEDYFGVNLQVISLGIHRQVACTVLANTLSEDLCQPEPGCSVGLQDLLEAGGHEACHGLLFKVAHEEIVPTLGPAKCTQPDQVHGQGSALQGMVQGQGSGYIAGLFGCSVADNQGRSTLSYV